MVSLFQECAPPGPAIGFIFFRLCDQIGWHGFGQARGPSSPHIGQIVQMLFWQFRAGLVSWASLTECVKMFSTGQHKAEQGTDQG